MNRRTRRLVAFPYPTWTLGRQVRDGCVGCKISPHSPSVPSHHVWRLGLRTTQMEKSITLNEAVARLMNINFITHDTDLFEYLENLVVEAENNLADAIDNEEPIEDYELIIKAANHRYQLAHCFKDHLLAELERSPEKSILKKSEQTSSMTHITVESLLNWASRHYQMGRLDYEELNDDLIELPTKCVEHEAVKIAEEGMTGKVALRLYILFAHLLELFIKAKQNKTGFGTPDAINVTQTAEVLHQSIAINRGNDRFYNLEIIKSRVEIAIAMKRLFGKK